MSEKAINYLPSLLKLKIIFILAVALFTSCSESKRLKYIPKQKTIFANKKLPDSIIKNWHLKDIEKDSLPGISLERAYTELLYRHKAKPVIVAVLDSEINIEHDALKEQIWVNEKEIPDNGIDDDNNGYIDDIHGWNYIGTKGNDSVVFSSFSYTEVLKKYAAKFKNILVSEVKEDEKAQYKTYTRALKAYNNELEERKTNIETYNRIQRKYNKSRTYLHEYFSDDVYTKEQIDSVMLNIKDKEEKKYVSYMKYYLDNDINDSTIHKGINEENKLINQNLNYNPRYHTKDDPDDLTDFPYGNNNVSGIENFFHGTQMSSVIAFKRDRKEVKGIIDTAKIMCLNTSTAGDEFDKDIALAIRYAVDNGARVINMSFGKAFSLHPEWVKEAIIYAESKNVLIITSAGNDNIDLDNDYDYPNDELDDGREFSDNFLKVGATTYNLDSTLVSNFSNYGKKQVDVFAPGSRIDCLAWNESYIDYGTSLSSAIVSGVAALIFSYYPNLTAAEVKYIIMESGLPVDIMVNKPSYSEKKEKVPFSSLSKSGKIVNAYNSLIMAENISKVRKK